MIKKQYVVSVLFAVPVTVELEVNGLLLKEFLIPYNITIDILSRRSTKNTQVDKEIKVITPSLVDAKKVQCKIVNIVTSHRGVYAL